MAGMLCSLMLDDVVVQYRLKQFVSSTLSTSCDIVGFDPFAGRQPTL